MAGDLHCHSTMSDGSTPVDNVVEYAIQAGLNFISLTDHDTMAGVERAVNLGKRKGIRVIPGMEITTLDHECGRLAHLLCYMPRKTEKLEKLTAATLKERNSAIVPVVEEVAKHYPITLADVKKAAGDSTCIYRQHIIRALMDRGYTYAVFSDLYDIFKTIPYTMEYPDTRDVADMIKNAGGVACLAHPGHYDSIDLAWELAKDGKIQAIELSHPRNSESDREEIEKIIKQYWLVPTGGSDYHGFYSSVPHPLGTCTMPEEALGALIEVRNELNK
mgnify:FL=1